MPPQMPWYRLLVYFALGFGVATALVLLCADGPPGEPLEGRVYDAVTNAPLPGVEITAWPLEPVPGYDPLEHCDQSGPDGAFRIFLTEELLPARLHLRCDGYLPMQVLVVKTGVLAVALERSQEPEPVLRGENLHPEEIER